MSYFSSEERFIDLISKPKDISLLLESEMMLISGDFYGIQKFIFDRLSTKNASKVLRAKSAFIQIFTEYLARYICSELSIDEEAIISKNAGKFEILSSKTDIDLDAVQKRIDDYFIKNFYGLSGVLLCSIKCSREDFEHPKRYKDFRKRVIDEVENKKFQKFNLHRDGAYSILDYDTTLNNQTLCKICNIRKIDKENCSICDNFIELGKRLSFDEVDELVSSKGIIIGFNDDFVIDITLTQQIKSYILFEDKSPADFKTLADNSCQDMQSGIKALGILKADVDSMGKFLLEDNGVTDSFENFDAFSKTIDNFFSLYVPTMMRKNYPNSYIVFAGGDDLFLLGAWDEILKLSRKIHDDFELFTQTKLSISFGIAIVKPSTPISYLAEHTERLLEEAKEIDENKDAITLFGETVKWKGYLEIYQKLYPRLEDFETNLNTAFLYRLLELIEMSKRVKYQNNIPSTMWKSKFRYGFTRNVLEKMRGKEQQEKAKKILKILSELITHNPKETKMVLSEFIYKRRER